MADPTGLVPWIADLFRGRRRVRVLVHHGFFHGNPEPFYFVKVTNISRGRDVEITHAWFDADPRVDDLQTLRPLPARLQPEQTWEAWTPASRLAHASNVERLGRVLVTAEAAGGWGRR